MKQKSLATRIERRMMAITAVVALTVAGSCFLLLYRHAMTLQEQRLIELLNFQARLIESVAKYDAYFQSTQSPGVARSATLSQIKEAHRQYESLRSTGEIVLGERNGGEIVFHLPSKKRSFQVPQSVSWNTDWAKPMRLALEGGSGLIEAKDHSGDVVIGAYRYLPFFEMGLVVKVDKSEVQKGFLIAAGFTLLVATLAIVVASGLNRKMVTPLIRRIHVTTERLRKVSADAKTANRAKSEFLARMSHELRTPMNAVIGTTHLLRKTNLTATQAHYVSMNQTAAKSLLGIIDDILDLSKLEARKIRIESIEFTLSDLLQELDQRFHEQIKRKGITYKVNVAANVPQHLVGDPLRLRQILTNLLSNAIKFSDSGTVELEVTTLDRTVSASTLNFCVTDQGIGISEEQRATLFHPFKQGDGSITRKYGGSGLGLSISKNLVDLLRGSISAESTLGEGSRFCVRLQFGIAQGMPVSTKPLDTDITDHPSDLKGIHLLVVEDNEINQEIIAELLQEVGATVSLAGNGQTGIEKLSDPTIRLALVDIELPDIDGFSLARKMRHALEATGRRLPIVAVTAHALDEHRSRALAAGMDAFLSKPIEPKALYQTIHRLLGSAPSLETDPSLQSSPKPNSETKNADATTLPRFDLVEARKRVGQSTEFHARLTNKFRLNYRDAVGRISQLAKAGRQEEARRLAHSVKGVSGNLGMVSVSRVAAQIEQQLKSNPASTDSESIADLLTKLQAALVEVFAKLPSKASPTPSAKVAPPDRLPIAEKAEELDQHLKRGRPIPAKKCLTDMLANPEFESYRPTLQQIEESLARYRFDQARSRLKCLLNSPQVGNDRRTRE